MEVINDTTFTKCRSLVRRPLEINFSDGKEIQRIEPISEFYIDETRLNKDNLAKKQFDGYVKDKKVRILATGVIL